MAARMTANRDTTAPIAARERLAITSTLQRFARAGLGRADLREAWELSTPGLRAATARRAWLRGNVPFLEYRARPFDPDAWRAVDATRDEVVLDLLVQPAAGSDNGPATLTFDVRRLGRSWKVQSVYAAVLFSPTGEKPQVFSERDLTPGPSGGPPPASKARLSSAWLLAPVLGFVLLLAAVAVAVVRTRRTA